ncbi:MAG: hypothetical protein RMJ36_00575 [Candidatus Calescibacterium sp.]|nr:hypothetical protein [Candidatus Calescibacterium sp.]MDW8132139.1 hypothetical protein [Candidatus Calescibacterium sp.]
MKQSFFVFEFMIIFCLLSILFWIFNNILVSKPPEYGVYENKSFLPTFNGNSIQLMLNDNGNRISLFLGRSVSEMVIQKDYVNIKIGIYLRYISNFQILFYNFDLFKYLLNNDEKIDIEIKNGDSWVFYEGKVFQGHSNVTLEKYDLMKKNFIRLVASVYFDDKGILVFKKKIYIERIYMRLNFLKVGK